MSISNLSSSQQIASEEIAHRLPRESNPTKALGNPIKREELVLDEEIGRGHLPPLIKQKAPLEEKPAQGDTRVVSTNPHT